MSLVALILLRGSDELNAYLVSIHCKDEVVIKALLFQGRSRATGYQVIRAFVRIGALGWRAKLIWPLGIEVHMLMTSQHIGQVGVFLEELFQVGHIARAKLVLVLIAFNRAVHKKKYVRFVFVCLQILFQKLPLALANESWRLGSCGLLTAITFFRRRSLAVVGIDGYKP